MSRMFKVSFEWAKKLNICKSVKRYKTSEQSHRHKTWAEYLFIYTSEWKKYKQVGEEEIKTMI